MLRASVLLELRRKHL